MAEQAKFTQVQQIASEWGQFVANQVSHLESFFGELSRLEAAGATQMIGAWEDAGRYARESLAQADRVGAEWRKLAFEATRRTVAAVTPKQPA